jgi:hypothetical protein
LDELGKERALGLLEKTSYLVTTSGQKPSR